MTIDDLVKDARENYLDDVVTPYLWSTLSLTNFANESVTEACLRAFLIRRLYKLSVKADKAEYTIDPTVRTILTAKLNGSNIELLQQTREWMYLSKGLEWEKRTGEPTHFIRTGLNIKLYPIPKTADTLLLSTSNIPDDDFDIEEDIKPEYQSALVYWILYRAYMKRDTDTYNPVKAADYLKMFEAVFGAKHTAKYDSFVQNSARNPQIIPRRMA